MSLYVYAGFDLAHIGNVTLSLTDDSGTFPVTVSGGPYTHFNISGVVSSVTPFHAALKTALDSSGTSHVYTVAYTEATRKYTIDVDNLSAWSMASLNAVAQHALGFTSSGTHSSVSGVITSAVSVYYSIAAAEGAQMDVIEYEPPELGDVAEGDDGSSAMVTRSVAPMYYDCTIPFEPQAIVYDYALVSANRWTWQKFFAHVRTTNAHFALRDSGTAQTSVHRLRKDSLAFAPEPPTGDRSYQAYMHIPLKTYMLGRL